MRKQIEVTVPKIFYYCDDCGREVYGVNNLTKVGKDQSKEVCSNCDDKYCGVCGEKFCELENPKISMDALVDNAFENTVFQIEYWGVPFVCKHCAQQYITIVTNRLKEYIDKR